MEIDLDRLAIGKRVQVPQEQPAGPPVQGTSSADGKWFFHRTSEDTWAVTDARINRTGPPVEVWSRLHCLGVTPDGSTAYMTRSGGFEIYPVDLAARKVGRQIALDRTPLTVVFDRRSTRAYVGCMGTGTIWVIDVRTQRTLARLRIGPEIKDMALASDDSFLWACDELGASVIVIDTSKAEIASRIFLGKGSMPCSLVIL